jgi:hypothetical protein
MAFFFAELLPRYSTREIEATLVANDEFERDYNFTVVRRSQECGEESGLQLMAPMPGRRALERLCGHPLSNDRAQRSLTGNMGEGAASDSLILLFQLLASLKLCTSIENRRFSLHRGLSRVFLKLCLAGDSGYLSCQMM